MKNEDDYLILDEQFERLMGSELFVHYVGMFSPPRPDITRCILLSQKKCVCDAQSQELFMVRIAEWNGVMWSIVSVRAEYTDVIEEVADNCDVKIIKGIPVMIDDGDIRWMFPVGNGRIFTFV
ncbi:MAG: hypothetical protein U0944_02060 [Candidatus Moranbacteria bacterium]|nr:hypothetical protein [Candidatus Moranbacteria bacterium]